MIQSCIGITSSSPWEQVVFDILLLIVFKREVLKELFCAVDGECDFIILSWFIGNVQFILNLLNGQ